MKPQARNEVIRAVLPALIGLGVFTLLWGLSYWAYDSLLSGSPFDTPYPAIGVSPSMLWDAWHPLPSISSDGEAFITWALACSLFVMGPLVAFLLSRVKAAYMLSLAFLLGVITHGCWDVIYFMACFLGRYHPPVTCATLASVAWPSVAWIFALADGGAIIGIAAPRIARAVRRRAARRRRRECR